MRTPQAAAAGARRSQRAAIASMNRRRWEVPVRLRELRLG